MTDSDASRLLDDTTDLVSRAAAAVLEAIAGGLETRAKSDESPVTRADMAAQGVLMDGLTTLRPGVPLVSEEAVDEAPAELGATFWLVDPVDGTKELVAGRDEYTINVALLRDGVPWLGIVAAPARGEIWRGVVGRGAEFLKLAPGRRVAEAEQRTPIHTRQRPAGRMVAACSRSHPDPKSDALLAEFGDVIKIECGSALKFCRVAEGAADLYPRLGTTCEWDIAAGHALIVAAGGAVVTPHGTPVVYGQADKAFRVPGFLAVGDPTLLSRLTGKEAP
jgi:3'(2'), 5'-bisphosphate nucleotidase